MHTLEYRIEWDFQISGWEVEVENECKTHKRGFGDKRGAWKIYANEIKGDYGIIGRLTVWNEKKLFLFGFFVLLYN